jgi:hypothetical protein
MILPIVMVLIMYLLLPAALLRSLWKGSVQSRTEWYVKLLAIAMFFVWIFFSGRWDWVGYPLRWPSGAGLITWVKAAARCR